MNDKTLMNSIKINSKNANETKNIGKIIGKIINPGDIIILKGEMGTGKTTLTQGIGDALEVQSVVNSPTFILLAKHVQARIPLYHADLFRLSDYKGSIELDLAEEAHDGVLVIEWPEIAEEVLPVERLEIEFFYAQNEHERIIKITDKYTKYEKLIEEIKNIQK